MPYSLPSRYLNIISRVGRATDKERTTAALGCILVRINAHGEVRIAATDGKILAECHVIGEAKPAAPIDYLIPWAGSSEVRQWVKEAEKAAKKAMATPLTLDYEGKDLVLTFGGMGIRTKRVEAIYPNYEPSLANSLASPSRVALDSDYLSRVNAIVADGASDRTSTVRIRQGRGWVFEPLQNTDGVRCLIMPVSLPKEDGDVTPIEVNPDRLKELEGYEAAVKSGATSTSPDPALVEAAQAAQARVATLEGEVVTLRERLSQALANAVQPAPSPLVKWRPHSQSKQLLKAGLTVKDLKAAGFRWQQEQWVGETPECQHLYDRIIAVAP